MPNQRGTSPYDHLRPGSSLYRDQGRVDSPVGSKGCEGSAAGAIINHNTPAVHTGVKAYAASILAQLLSGCVTVGKSPDLPEPVSLPGKYL